MTMKTLKEIMDLIELPEMIQTELLSMESSLSQQKKNHAEYIQNLTIPQLWESAKSSLKELLAPDENGFKMLSYMLSAACYSYEKYREMGISEKIFIDTMKCFSRFVKENKESFGFYVFNQDFWTGRQLSLQLFRLNDLEFELYMDNSTPTIAIHIPSDAVLSEQVCKDGVRTAQEFVRKYFTNYIDAPFSCNSWLLSPNLKKLLPPTSNILKFQNMFQIQQIDENCDKYMKWVYKKNYSNFEDLPEDTSLQRKMKVFLLQGGKIGSAKGYLIL